MHEDLAQDVREIREAQARIEEALLGSMEKPGLLEEQRNMKRELDALTNASKIHATDIAQLKEFRRDMKKMVTGIALLIPFAFEIGKGLLTVVWEFVKGLVK